MKTFNLYSIPFLGIFLILIHRLIVIVLIPITSPAYGFNAKFESEDKYDIEGDYIPDSIEEKGLDVNEDRLIDLNFTSLEKNQIPHIRIYF